MGQMRAFGGLVALCRFLRLVIAVQIGLRDWPSLVAFFALHSPSRVGPRKLEAQPSDEMIKANF